MRNQIFIIGGAGVSAVVISVILSWWLVMPSATPEGGTIGGPFRLINHQGNTVSERVLHDRYSLLVFGYRSCPDICPFILQVTAQAIDQLGTEDPPSQPIFITIDPERDTPETLATYVSLFHPMMIGLTGTLQQIEHVAKLYKVYYSKVLNEDTMQSHSQMNHDHGDHGNSDYLMNHTTLIYLMDPQGQFVTAFPMHTSPDVIANMIRTHSNNS